MSKTLVILESPAKAKKVAGFLGADYIVRASVGHVRELPPPNKMTPAEKEKYSEYAIDIQNNFSPLFKNSRDKAKVIADLKTQLAKCDKLIGMTDDDSEGASILWHLLEILKPKVPVYRAVTHEITKTGVEDALKNMELVDQKKKQPDAFYGAAEAALTRALWDRLYGFSTSPYVWKTIKSGTSSGRVQTPGARLVVEREMKRLAFKSVSYYSISGLFGEHEGTLVEYKKQKIASGSHIDDEGVVKKGYLLITDDNLDDILKDLRKKDYVVGEVSSKPYRRSPPPPFTTAAALQSIGAKTRMGSKQITSILQNLYASDGAITYIRTVSVEAAPEAIKAARASLKNLYGTNYVPGSPRVHKDKKSGNSGHEAIRPVLDDSGNLLKKSFSDKKVDTVFDLIYRRMLASQSIDCVGTTWSASFVAVDGLAKFTASETEIHEPGWTKVYDAEDVSIQIE